MPAAVSVSASSGHISSCRLRYSASNPGLSCILNATRSMDRLLVSYAHGTAIFLDFPVSYEIDLLLGHVEGAAEALRIDRHLAGVGIEEDGRIRGRGVGGA